jgi:predicted DNA-binding transcriptional regulator AlpA
MNRHESDRFLNRKVLRQLIGKSDSTITRWINDGKLPMPVDIGMEPYQPAYRWLASEVETYLEIPVLAEEEIQNRYLDTKEIENRIGALHSTIPKWRSQDHFPEPTSNTGSNNYWSRIAIDERIVKIFKEDREKY